MVGRPNMHGCWNVKKSEVESRAREDSRRQEPKVQVDSPENLATRWELYTWTDGKIQEM